MPSIAGFGPRDGRRGPVPPRPHGYSRRPRPGAAYPTGGAIPPRAWVYRWADGYRT